MRANSMCNCSDLWLCFYNVFFVKHSWLSSSSSQHLRAQWKLHVVYKKRHQNDISLWFLISSYSPECVPYSILFFWQTHRALGSIQTLTVPVKEMSLNPSCVWVCIFCPLPSAKHNLSAERASWIKFDFILHAEAASDSQLAKYWSNTLFWIQKNIFYGVWLRFRNNYFFIHVLDKIFILNYFFMKSVFLCFSVCFVVRAVCSRFFIL